MVPIKKDVDNFAKTYHFTFSQHLMVRVEHSPVLHLLPDDPEKPKNIFNIA